MSDNSYQPPKVWEWNQNNGGAFANINRPVSGATHEKVLPVGAHPLQLYSLGTPNGQKVTIMLEELLALGITAAEYDAWFVTRTRVRCWWLALAAKTIRSMLSAKR
jgi:GST-like protein